MIKLAKIQPGDQNLELIQANMDKAFTALQVKGGMPYAPTKPSNWAGTPPATMQDAFDRIAALLVTLNSGAIP